MAKRKHSSPLLRVLLFPLRLVGLLGIFAVLLLLSVTAFLRVMLTREELASLITTQLQDALGRPVQVADVNVMLLQGIRIRGLRVLESPGFPGPDLLTSEIAIAKYRWRALLQRRLEFSEVRLVGPRIQLVRRQDGEWNVEGLVRERAAAPRKPLPIALAADVISIENGQLSVNDLVRHRLIEVRGFQLKIRDFSSTESFPFDLSFETDGNLGGKRVELRASASGALSLASFRWPDAWLEAQKIKLSANGASATTSGKLRSFTAPVLDLKLKLPRLTSESLSLLKPVPSGITLPPLLAELRLSRPTTGTIALESAEFSAEPLRLRASGSLQLGREPSYRLNLSIPPSSLERITALWSGWAWRRMSGTADCALSVSGKLGPDDHPSVDRLGMHLKDFSTVVSTNAAISGADVTITGGKKLEEIEVLAPRGRVTAYGNVFSEIDLALRLGGGDLDIERLQLAWSNSHLKLKGRIHNLSAPKGVDIEGSVDKLELQEAIAAATAVVQQIRAARPSQPVPGGEEKWSRVFKYAIPRSFPATNGSLRITELSHPNFRTANVDLKWGLRGISTGLGQASGWVRTGFGPGRVTDIPELEKSHKILKVIFLPFVFMHKMNKFAKLSTATAYPKTLDFTRIYGQYNLQQGVVDIGAFHVDSGQLVAYAEGKVDFPKEKVGLHVLTRLTSSGAGLPLYLVDEAGRFAIGFWVKDDLNTPSLEIDLHKMKRSAIEDALQAGLKRGQESQK